MLAIALLAAAVALATISPAFQTQPAHVAAADREVTAGKRKDQVVEVYEKVKAGVVNIHSERTVTAPADDPFTRTQSGLQRLSDHLAANAELVHEDALLELREAPQLTILSASASA